MALTFPVPNDATYDYVPIQPENVRVGTDLVSCWSLDGEISFAVDNGGGTWFYLIDWTAADGSAGSPYGLTWNPGSQPAVWWQRTAVWKRTAKLADGATITAADGSKWRYPAGEDGRMVCTQPGTTFARGARRFRGELTTDPDDYWICDDPDWDWLPVTDGSQLTTGDTARFLMTLAGVVASIDMGTPVDDGTYQQNAFLDGSSVTIGIWDQVFGPTTNIALNSWTFFSRLTKPAANSSFRAPDGSRWDYVGSSFYYCWGRGTTYAPGAIFYRGGVAGGLTSIT